MKGSRWSRTHWNICWQHQNPEISAKDLLDLIDTWRDLQRHWRERPRLEVCLKDYDALLDGGQEDGSEEPTGRKEVAV